MSLFDKPEKRNLAEVFPPGTPFRLVEAWIEGQVETGSMGHKRTLAKVVVSPVEDPANESEYGVWGSLAQQIRKLEAGELPLIVTLANSSGEWLFAPHGPVGAHEITNVEGDVEEEVPRLAVPEAHLDLEAGESDAPNLVPPAAAPVGTPIDDSHSMKPPELPPAAKPRGTDLDEDQAFTPQADTPIQDQ